MAVLPGPAGIGLLGIYQSITGVATPVARCGLGSSCVRQLAAPADTEEILTAVRRAFLTANLVLGLMAMLIVWIARETIAERIFDGAIQANDVGW